MKAAKEKRLIKYKVSLINLTAEFSLETLGARRQWNDICKVLKGKTKPNQTNKQTCQLSTLYLTKLSIKNEDGIKIFSDKQNLREILPQDLFYKKMLKKIHQIEIKGHQK